VFKMGEKLGERLEKLRKLNNLTQEQISNYLDLDQSNYSKIEKGKRNLNVSSLDKVCLLYDCSPEYLLGESDVYNPQKIAFRLDKKDYDLNVVSKINETMKYLNLLEELNDGE